MKDIADFMTLTATLFSPGQARFSVTVPAWTAAPYAMTSSGPMLERTSAESKTPAAAFWIFGILDVPPHRMSC